jgi:Tol biopolymer transport system component
MTPVFAGNDAVVFVSGSADLGPTPAWCSASRGGVVRYYVCPNIYRRDLRQGTTTLVSANANGLAGGNGPSTGPVVSPDGTKVAFVSQATNLDAPGTEGRGIHVRDLTTGRTTLVTRRPDGTATSDSSDAIGGFDPTGERLVYTSRAAGLVEPDVNGVGDVFLYELASRRTWLVSVNAAGTATANGGSDLPAFVTSDRVAFRSGAGDLLAGGPVVDTNGTGGLYLASPRLIPL